MKGRNHIVGAMRNHNIVFFIVACLLLFGFISLPNLNKDEFPQFTIPQAVVAVIYPGATAEEMEAQVTKPLEQFLFTYQAIDKESTYSTTEDGVVYVYACLRRGITDSDEVWGKVRDGLALFKQTGLPAGVLGTAVIDDFGSTSSMLLAIESPERTPRELEDYANQLCDRLRTIPQMGNLKILGKRTEEIAITIDADKLSTYGINQTTILAQLATQGFRTVSGNMANNAGDAMLHVEIPYTSEYEIGQQIVYFDPVSNHTLRLCDIATIDRRYKKADSYIEHYESTGDKASCVVINMEMYPGNNIVAFGDDVEAILNEARNTFPSDIRFHRITDQPKVVEDSVFSFLRDLLLSIIVVIIVMLVLFPLRTALVACTSVPVCTAICLGIMWMTGIELNTVTLAALIVVLGMIVDDSVIVIDGYSNLLEKGHSRWYCASESTRVLFIPMALATCSISGMFFPMTRIITGPFGEFIQDFPWAVAFALTASIFYAVWCIPYLSTCFIKRLTPEQMNPFERGQSKFFALLQNTYKNILTRCFAHPFLTIFFTTFMVCLGGFLFSRLNVQMMPKADRECFAVEIHMAEGSSLEQTAEVADSLAKVLRVDPRIISVTSFIGSGSPRFHCTYAPHMASKSYAQFIVNTKSQKATKDILAEYAPQYENAFPNAYVRFKQMDYQAVKNPVEVYVKGDDLSIMEPIADSIKVFMANQPEMTWVHSDYDACVQHIKITLKTDEAARLGVSQSLLSLYLSSSLGGQALTSIWEDDYNVPVMIYTEAADSLNYEDINNLLVPTSLPGVWVPVRQVADISAEWHHPYITRHNSIRTITVGADLRGEVSQPIIEHRVEKYIAKHIEPNLPQGVSISYGGLTASNDSVIPELAWSVVAALLVMFILMIYHFGKLSTACLALSMSIICLFGACLGLWLFGLDFSITALLGVVSLIGIIVRNAIIMYEYAEQLRREKHISTKEAAYEAGLRRMRPIFLTSATTALGVIPMITAHTALWMPMGVVICFGTIFTLPLVVTILPVAYWKTYAHEDKKKNITDTEFIPN